MHLVLQTANVVSDAKNCLYPNRVEVTNAKELQEAVKFDHVCAEYTKNYRNIRNFIRSNVVVMDCDNDHTENPDEWIQVEQLEDLFGDVSYAVAFSRNHMKEKDGKAARPKFHVYFEIAETDDAEHYAAIKAAIKKAYPFFDGNALDAARFLFGADSGECIWNEGWDTIDEQVEIGASDDEDTGTQSGPIMEGSRNNSMSHFAGRVLKRYGNTDKAYEAFMEHAKRCDPPLSKEELATIWNSAVRFFNKKVAGSDGYVPPEQYNAEFGGESLKPDDYSDMGQAKVLVREYGDELKFTDATDFLRYNGEFWDENSQASIGAVEEFLDMQLVDAQEQFDTACQVLIDAGIPEKIVKAGGKALEKEIPASLEKEFKRYLAAKAYLAFVIKYRNFKYIVSTQNAAKPMVATDINEFDANENLLNTPYAT